MLGNIYGPFPGRGPGPCPVDGTPNCGCVNPLQPEPVHVLGIEDLNSGPQMSNVQATQDIVVPNPAAQGMPGAGIVLYKAGDTIRLEDVEMLEDLGLMPSGLAAQAQTLSEEQEKAIEEPPKDKARRGPRENTKATRDKQLTSKEE